MKYIEVETPYGLQKYPAYGIGGFIKDVLGGLKKVAKKSCTNSSFSTYLLLLVSKHSLL
jgi:hypothetical protein